MSTEPPNPVFVAMPLASLPVMLATLREGVVVLAADGRIVEANPAATRILGAERAALVGRSGVDRDWQVCHEDGSELLPEALPASITLRTGKPVTGFILGVRSGSGERRWLEVNSAPWRDEANHAGGAVITFLDVTAGRDNERRLLDTNLVLATATKAANEMAQRSQAANSAKSEFLANMSHEIRTPLTAILGYAELLRDDARAFPDGSPQRASLDTIQTAGEHLLTVLNDVLDLSKIEAGRMDIEAVECNLPGMLDEVLTLLRPRTAVKGVKLTAHLASPVPERVISDPTRLRQLLMNLIGNATKFTAQGRIDVVVAAIPADSHGPERLCVRVRDTGPGMTKEQAAALFQPFTQADPSLTRRFGGSGLGLTICRRLAKLLGGEVRLEDTQLDVGSTFAFEVPLVQASGSGWVSRLRSEAVATTAKDAKPTNGDETSPVRLHGRILLAEDGRDNQLLLGHVLRKAGADVSIVGNGAQALDQILQAAAAGRPFDLLITDIQMPVMDGFTLAKRVRTSGDRLPIIALTAHAMAEDRERCLLAGCDDYTTKPIDRAHLLKTCAIWLSGAADGG
jgi:PAS domain S-box-containing protein